MCQGPPCHADPTRQTAASASCRSYHMYQGSTVSIFPGTCPSTPCIVTTVSFDLSNVYTVPGMVGNVRICLTDRTRPCRTHLISQQLTLWARQGVVILATVAMTTVRALIVGVSVVTAKKRPCGLRNALDSGEKRDTRQGCYYSPMKENRPLWTRADGVVAARKGTIWTER